MSTLPTFVPKAPPGHKYVLEKGSRRIIASCSCGKYLGIAKELGEPWCTGVTPRDIYDLHKVVLSHRSAVKP